MQVLSMSLAFSHSVFQSNHHSWLVETSCLQHEELLSHEIFTLVSQMSCVFDLVDETQIILSCEVGQLIICVSVSLLCLPSVPPGEHQCQGIC